MLVRALSETDLTALLAMEQATQLVPWTEDVFKRCFEMKCMTFALEEEGQLKGFLIALLRSGECHILNLCIHPDHHHQGLGKKLLNTALQTIQNQGGNIAFLEVRRSNFPAIGLYNKLGFIQVSERKNYYLSSHGSEDALIFVKDLGIT